MRLVHYRKLKALTRRAAAAELGVTEVTLWRWETGRQTPRPADIGNIRDWSQGAVTADDLIAVAQKVSQPGGAV